MHVVVVGGGSAGLTAARSVEVLVARLAGADPKRADRLGDSTMSPV
jgi:ribulose 1,5-bisphosphate synthetase/thiazole synthase